jgi:predicted esterase
MPLTPQLLDDVPPTFLYLPPGEHESLPLVLVGHGAHLNKDDQFMQILAKGFCRNVPAAVALMDCPGHGDRRTPGLSDEEFDADVQRRMSEPEYYAELEVDWTAVEKAARAADARITGPTGFAGFSMGAMIGFSIVGDLPSVKAAVFALGGLTPHEGRNAIIRAGAQRLGDREVLMLNMTHDEYFAMPGALDLFDAIPGPKRMGVWPGGHTDIGPEAIQWAIQFLQRTLA